MEQAAIAYRGEQYGKGDVLAKDSGVQVAFLKDDRAPRAKAEFSKSAQVIAKSYLIVSATVEVIEDTFWQPAMCSTAKVTHIDAARGAACRG
jgi:hypothetical protein